MRTFLLFLFIGGAGAAAYVLLSSALTAAGVAVSIASVLVYCGLVPVVYLAQRRFAFGSAAAHRSAFPKYMGTQVIGIFLATVLPHLLVAYGGMAPAFGFAAVAVTIAVTNFLLLRAWAFSEKKRTVRHGGS